MKAATATGKPVVRTSPSRTSVNGIVYAYKNQYVAGWVLQADSLATLVQDAEAIVDDDRYENDRYEHNLDNHYARTLSPDRYAVWREARDNTISTWNDLQAAAQGIVDFNAEHDGAIDKVADLAGAALEGDEEAARELESMLAEGQPPLADDLKALIESFVEAYDAYYDALMDEFYAAHGHYPCDEVTKAWCERGPDKNCWWCEPFPCNCELWTWNEDGEEEEWEPDTDGTAGGSGGGGPAQGGAGAGGAGAPAPGQDQGQGQQPSDGPEQDAAADDEEPEGPRPASERPYAAPPETEAGGPPERSPGVPGDPGPTTSAGPGRRPATPQGTRPPDTPDAGSRCSTCARALATVAEQGEAKSKSQEAAQIRCLYHAAVASFGQSFVDSEITKGGARLEGRALLAELSYLCGQAKGQEREDREDREDRSTSSGTAKDPEIPVTPEGLVIPENGSVSYSVRHEPLPVLPGGGGRTRSKVDCVREVLAALALGEDDGKWREAYRKLRALAGSLSSPRNSMSAQLANAPDPDKKFLDAHFWATHFAKVILEECVRGTYAGHVEDRGPPGRRTVAGPGNGEDDCERILERAQGFGDNHRAKALFLLPHVVAEPTVMAAHVPISMIGTLAHRGADHSALAGRLHAAIDEICPKPRHERRGRTIARRPPGCATMTCREAVEHTQTWPSDEDAARCLWQAGLTDVTTIGRSIIEGLGRSPASGASRLAWKSHKSSDISRGWSALREELTRRCLASRTIADRARERERRTQERERQEARRRYANRKRVELERARRLWSWLRLLPECPETRERMIEIVQRGQRPQGWRFCIDTKDDLHQPHAECFRTIPRMPGANPGQQCCYDTRSGGLITRDSRAGTPDRVSVVLAKNVRTNECIYAAMFSRRWRGHGWQDSVVGFSVGSVSPEEYFMERPPSRSDYERYVQEVAEGEREPFDYSDLSFELDR